MLDKIKDADVMKFNLFILVTAVFVFVFTLIATYFLIFYDFMQSLKVTSLAVLIFVPLNIVLQKVFNKNKFK